MEGRNITVDYATFHYSDIIDYETNSVNDLYGLNAKKVFHIQVFSITEKIQASSSDRVQKNDICILVVFEV